jgi:hypothetical protein
LINLTYHIKFILNEVNFTYSLTNENEKRHVYLLQLN